MKSLILGILITLSSTTAFAGGICEMSLVANSYGWNTVRCSEKILSFEGKLLDEMVFLESLRFKMKTRLVGAGYYPVPINPNATWEVYIKR